ncbi:MAG: erythromycin esterase family protein [Bacteroidota bacterium]
MDKRITILTWLFMLGAFWLPAQEETFTDYAIAAGQVTPLKSVEHIPASWWAWLDDTMEEVQILGLGEVSHYTRECYAYKRAIIEHLAKQGLLQALVLEVDFGQALFWNEYLLTGVGNPDSLVQKSGWFTYRTEEFRDLLVALRKHNEQAETPIQIFGMEMTTVQSNLEWMERYVAESGLGTEELATQLEAERTMVVFWEHDQTMIQGYWDLYYTLQGWLASNAEALQRGQGETTFANAERIVEIFRQYATYVAQDDFSLQVTLRDLFSTRNVAWVHQQLGEDARLAIWAHNGHVNLRSVRFGYPVLGEHLNRWYGEAYFAIGFTFGSGQFGSFSENDGFKIWTYEEAPEGSLQGKLGALSLGDVYMDIRRLLKEDRNLDSYLRSSILYRGDLGEFLANADFQYTNPINLSSTYDGLIYLHRTQAPTGLEWIRGN